MATLRTPSLPFRLIALSACIVASPACRRAELPKTQAALAPVPEAQPRAAVASPGKTEAKASKPPTPLQRCFPEDTALSPPRSLQALLNRAADRIEQASQEQRICQDSDAKNSPMRLLSEALACAEESLRQQELSVEAHHNRALALLGLGQKDEAKLAFTHALALAPDDPETLAGAAELYIHHLPATIENTQIGLAYVRHGKEVLRREKREDGPRRALRATPEIAASRQGPRGPSAAGRPERPLRPIAGSAQRSLLSRLLLMEGQSLIDLGRAGQALAPLDEAIALSDNDQARYERGLVLFDLCRLKEAQRAFAELVRRTPDDAWAHHQLGLVLEMLGESAAAEKELASARKLAPQDFPDPLPISVSDFRTIVDEEVAALPQQSRSDLRLLRLELADLPDVADLTADLPILSPTIVGLFRGLPLGMPDSEPRSMVLYRKNLLRIVATREEFRAQVRTTLLHELGHLRGEDDDELRARGLE